MFMICPESVGLHQMISSSHTKKLGERFRDHLRLDVVSKCDLLHESPIGIAADDDIGRCKRFGPDGSIRVSVKCELGVYELKARVHDLLLSQMARIRGQNSRVESSDMEEAV